MSCVICGRFGDSENVLVNGSRYHSSCYTRLQSLSKTLTEEIKEISHEIYSINQKITRRESILYKVVSFFGGEKIDVDGLRNRLAQIRPKLKEKKEELSSCQRQLSNLWDFWPTYPPDWNDRTQASLLYSNGCAKCGTKKRLNVHHIMGIRDGGSHQQHNLEVLCEKCHGKKHKADFSEKEYNHFSTPSAFSKRLNLIEEAIRDKKPIHFSYKKFEGEKSVRTIDPEGIKQVGKSLCVYGWCHLRKDKRIFAIRRMRGVKKV